MQPQFIKQDLGFIGREKEIQLFRQWLSTRSALFYICDASTEKNEQGGIGKTWLLRKFYQLIEKEHTHSVPVMIDFFNPEDRDGITIARRVVTALRNRYPDWQSKEFEAALEEYHKVTQNKGVEGTGMREQITQALSSDLREKLLKEKVSIVIFFDTFERIEDSTVTAVIHSGQIFPDTYGLERIRSVIAGRNAPQWDKPEWKDRRDAIDVHELSGFTLDETRTYLQENAPVRISFIDQSVATTQALYRLTQGRPILLGLLVDILQNPAIKLSDIVAMSRNQMEETLVQLLNLLRPVDRVMYCMAHIYHRFDISMLKAISSEISLSQLNLEELFTQASLLSVVRTAHSHHDVLVLHDEMRRLVKDYCWPREDPTQSIRLKLSNIMRDHYTSRLATTGDEELRKSYLVERLFHELFVDVTAGIESFSRLFRQALDVSQSAFARLLLQEVKKFGEESLRSRERRTKQLSDDQRKDLKMAEAELFLQEENPQTALLMYEELEQDKDWAQHRTSALLYGKAECYFHAESYDEAIKSYEQCLQIEQENPDRTRTGEICNALGLIARRQARYPEARDYYLQSLDIFKGLRLPQRYASIYNNLGHVYRLLGEPDTGLLYCRRGLQIRESLYKEGRIGLFHVGLSHSTLGHIYHTRENLAEEEFHYRRAFEIFSTLGFRSYLSFAYSNLGKIWVATNELDKAFEYFTKAYDLAKGVSHEAEIESLNQQGRVFRQRKQWQAASERFAQAVAVSQDIGHRFNAAENLLYLADVCDEMEKPSQDLIDEAKKIAPHLFVQARAEEIQGDIHHRKGDYRTAFEHYGRACNFMARYGKIEFAKLLRRFENKLLETPEELLPAIISSLRSYWSSQQLDDAHPELPAVCRLVQNL